MSGNLLNPRRLVIFVAAVLLILVGNPTKALGQNFSTQSFRTDITIRQTGDLDVVETIQVNFLVPQRGLVRRIPVVTRSEKGDRRRVNLKVDGAQINAGAGFEPVPIRAEESSGDMNIRIGDPNVRRNGNVTYQLRYRLVGALTEFPDATDSIGPRIELLWNVTPPDWSTSIARAQGTIAFPNTGNASLEARIVAGPKGSKIAVSGTKQSPTAENDLLNLRVEPAKVVWETKKSLRKGEGVTAGVALPLGLVNVSKPMIRKAKKEIPFIGLIPLSGLIAIYLLSRRRWPTHRPLVVRFEPPSAADPSLCGLILDNRVDRQDVVAGIISLAQKGALRLHHVEEESAGMWVELIGIVPGNEVTVFESRLFEALTPYGPIVTPAALRGQFGTQFFELSRELREFAKSHGLYLDGGPGKVAVGCMVPILIGALTFISLLISPGYAILGGIVALVIGFILVAKMSDYSSTGLHLQWEVRGLREFISRVQEKELRYMASKMPDQALFETLLPYAVAFGLVDKWTEAFRGIDMSPPDWYVHDGVHASMNMYWATAMMTDLNSFNREFGEALSFTPSQSDSGGTFSSGDSGFSGGGFSSGDGGGGGGGDSW